MARVTSNFEVTIPEDLARACGIAPGDEVKVSRTEGGIQITPASDDAVTANRLKWFDEAMARQDRRHAENPVAPSNDRGWTREDLYDDRGLSRQQ